MAGFDWRASGKKTVLGLDIHEDLVSGVLLELKGRYLSVVDCWSMPLDASGPTGGMDLPLTLPGFAGTQLVCGLPLAVCSLRNLSLPFTDQKKIRQVLSLELEEQMLLPLDRQVIGFDLFAGQEGQGRILAVAVEKEYLGTLLGRLKEAGADPPVVEPAIHSLAKAVSDGTEDDFLLLDAGMHGLSMALCSHGRILFLRQLSYPERMFTNPPFCFRDGQVEVVNGQEAEECIRALCPSILTSLDYFRIESDMEVKPRQVLLNGILAAYEPFAGFVREELHMEPVLVDLLDSKHLSRTDTVSSVWQGWRYNRALALALGGMEKKHPLNFRRDEFVCRHRYLEGRNLSYAAVAAGVLLLAGITGYMALDAKRLQRLHDQDEQRIRTIFMETFPGTQRIVDPYAQMKAAAGRLVSPSNSMPVFAGEQRMLEILADISGRLPPSLSLHVSRLTVDQQTVQIKGSTDAFNNVDLIKSKLASSPRYGKVDILSATADKEAGGVRFEIRLTLGAQG